MGTGALRLYMGQFHFHPGKLGPSHSSTSMQQTVSQKQGWLEVQEIRTTTRDPQSNQRISKSCVLRERESQCATVFGLTAAVGAEAGSRDVVVAAE